MYRYLMKLLLAGVFATGVLMIAASGAPATAQGMADDSACLNEFLSGEEFGLCNAYCEAMDCDGTPQASDMACQKVQDKFEAIAFDPVLPCLGDPPLNTAPVVDLNGVAPGIDTTATFVSFGDAVPIAVDVVITDAEGDDIVSATVTLTNPMVGVEETLSLTPAGDLLITNELLLGDWEFESISGVLTINGTGDKATYALILLEVVYDNTLDTPNTTSRDVEVAVNDGTDISLVAAISVMATEEGCPCPGFTSKAVLGPDLGDMFAHHPLNRPTSSAQLKSNSFINGPNIDACLTTDLPDPPVVPTTVSVELTFDDEGYAPSRTWTIFSESSSSSNECQFQAVYHPQIPPSWSEFRTNDFNDGGVFRQWNYFPGFTDAQVDACRGRIRTMVAGILASYAAVGVPEC